MAITTAAINQKHHLITSTPTFCIWHGACCLRVRLCCHRCQPSPLPHHYHLYYCQPLSPSLLPLPLTLLVLLPPLAVAVAIAITTATVSAFS
jgi:hypothetical protein